MTGEERGCDWCGNLGHRPVDHPPPEGHEHYDPELDNPLLPGRAYACWGFPTEEDR